MTPCNVPTAIWIELMKSSTMLGKEFMTCGTTLLQKCMVQLPGVMIDGLVGTVIWKVFTLLNVMVAA